MKQTSVKRAARKQTRSRDGKELFSAAGNAVRNGGILILIKFSKKQFIHLLVLTAERSLLPMETITENIAPDSVISTNDSIDLENETLYFLALLLARSMLKNGIVNKNEYAEIDTILRKKFRPFLADLLSENT